MNSPSSADLLEREKPHCWQIGLTVSSPKKSRTLLLQWKQVGMTSFAELSLLALAVTGILAMLFL
jgi:hypothetical protein